MTTLTCLCGQIRIETAKRPDFLNECNCAFCRKSGARWAYFAPDTVRVDGNARAYCRTDKDDPTAQLHFCPQCGATTHFTLTQSGAAKHGNTIMGVNMRLAAASDLAGLELRFPDGAAWAGEGAFGYVRDAVVL